MFPNGNGSLVVLNSKVDWFYHSITKLITISCNIVSPFYGRKHRKVTTIAPTCISNWQCVLFQIISFCQRQRQFWKLLPF